MNNQSSIKGALSSDALEANISLNNNINGIIKENQLEGNIINNNIINGEIKTNSLVGNILASGGSGTRDYNVLYNKPQINEVELRGNKSLEDLEVLRLTNTDIEDLINSIV